MFFEDSFDTEREEKKNEKMSQLGRDETIEKARKDILSTVFIMNKWKFRKSLSRFIKCHILCARSAFIEKNTNTALQESFNDLSKSIRHFIRLFLSFIEKKILRFFRSETNN